MQPNPRWGPPWINGDHVGTDTAGTGRTHSDNRGVNSVQIISHLRAAASVVGDPTKYDNAVALLKEELGYGRNAVNSCILYPFDETGATTRTRSGPARDG